MDSKCRYTHIKTNPTLLQTQSESQRPCTYTPGTCTPSTLPITTVWRLKPKPRRHKHSIGSSHYSSLLSIFNFKCTQSHTPLPMSLTIILFHQNLCSVSSIGLIDLTGTWTWGSKCDQHCREFKIWPQVQPSTLNQSCRCSKTINLLLMTWSGLEPSTTKLLGIDAGLSSNNQRLCGAWSHARA